MIDTTSTPSRNRAVAGLNGTAAAFIDASMVLIMLLLFTVAALKLHFPEQVKIDMALAEKGLSGGEMSEPLVKLNILAGGAVTVNGMPAALSDLGEHLAPFAETPGEVGICVAEEVSWIEVRNAIAIAQATLGPRQWAECGGVLK